MPTYHLVDDLQAVPDGTTPITHALQAINGMDGDVTVKVPSGSYYLSSETHTISGPNHLTLETTDGADARFVCPGDFDGILLDIDVPLVWRNIDIGRTAGGAGPQIRLTTREETVVEDVTVVGRDDSGVTDGGLFLPRARTPQSRIILRDVDSPDGCWWASASSDGRAFARIGDRNTGTVRFEDCVVEEYAQHGIDARESQGPITVTGGRYANSDGVQILTGQDGSSVSGAEVVVDPDASGIPAADYSYLAGIRLDPAHSSAAGAVTISDTEIHMAGEGGGTATGGIHGTVAAWGVTIEDCRVRADGDGIESVNIAAPDGTVGSPSRVRMQDTVCSGAAVSGTAVDIAGRPNSEIVDCCIETPGTRRGLLLPASVTPTRTDLTERCWR